MSVSEKIKSLLSLTGKKQIELAEYFGMSPQAMRNKFARGSFSAEDLIKIGNFLDCSLEFKISEKQVIVLNDEKETDPEQ